MTHTNKGVLLCIKCYLFRQVEASDRRVVYEVPEAGELIGLGRNASYAAAKRGDIPTIRVGKLLKVPRAAFHQKFGA